MMDLIYENHLGQEIILYDYPIIIQSTNMFDYSWTTNSVNDKISGFKKGLTEFSFELLFHVRGDNAEYYLAEAMNDFYTAAEADVRAQKPGKLKYTNSAEQTWYMEGYFKSSANAKWNQGIKTAVKNVVFVTDKPYWVREVGNFEIIPVNQYSNHTAGLNGRDYASDGNIYGRGYIDNEAMMYADYSDMYYSLRTSHSREFLDLNFVIEIEPYDEVVEKPRIILCRYGDDEYAYDAAVDCTINPGEKLTITNLKNEQSIILTRANGKQINMFDKRDRNKDIFARIKSDTNGVMYIMYHTRFRATIRLIEYSSEPQWKF